MVSENKDKKRNGFFIVFIIVIVLFVLGFWLVGYQGILKVIKWVFIFALILAVLGAVFYFVWYFFFKKHKYDVTYVNKQKFMDACHKGNSGLLKGLYLSGDKGHSRIYWGKITGYCRISVLTRNLVFVDEIDSDGKPTGRQVVKKITDEKTGREQEVYTLSMEEQDVFSVTHYGWLLRLFFEDDVVRVNPKAHDELVGDITLYGYSLLPVSEYWFLNDDFLDVRKIDYAILKEAERGIMFEMLRDSKEIVDKASGLDSGHQKRIEEKSMYEIPVQK